MKVRDIIKNWYLVSSRVISINGKKARGYKTESGDWIVRHLTFVGNAVLDDVGNSFDLIGSELVDDNGHHFVITNVETGPPGPGDTGSPTRLAIRAVAMKRPTTDSQGRYNGYLIPIWNALDNPELRPDQVYLTAVAPHSRKGPHLHKVRRGLFCCVKGNVRIVTRRLDYRLDYRERSIEDYYEARFTGEDNYALVEVPPGIPCAIYNDGLETALVLNMPAPAWSKEDPDDWPVDGWDGDLVT